MTEVIVEHEWNASDSEKVMKVVGSIIEMQKNGSLPQGFSLKSVQLLKNRNKAICNWEATSAESLAGLIGKVNPPTRHTVTEVSRVL
ncbi:MAG: hypothetical protein M0Z77_03020 [Thermoplasmatales archaeon]|nr:hypothetical protein [Candidatus Thermoplasmatota archaeon]MCL6002036.1 hypothetical protein [Candidatus Thermoplasmatota archaeon]MDA8054608.1 hypothetical protein [Thermoplasmatales archaeon]